MQTLDRNSILIVINYIKSECERHEVCSTCPYHIVLDDGNILHSRQICFTGGSYAPEDWHLEELMEKMLEEVRG